MTEFKNSVSGLNIKLDVAEERFSELKDGSVLFLLVLLVVTTSFVFLIACWTLCLENSRGSGDAVFSRVSSDAELSVPQALEAGGSL